MISSQHAHRYRMLAAVHAFFIRDGQILLLRRFHTGYEDGNYSVPAGHVDEDESVIHALIREVKEEVGVAVEPKDAVVKHVMHRRTDDERIDFFFWITTWRGEPQNMEPNKCDELKWVPLHKLPTNVIPYIRQTLEYCQAGQLYSELGWK